MVKVIVRLFFILTLLSTSFFTLAAEPKVIHVLVALCDNKYQGIAPVPQALGNGQDPNNNLYWGAGYGFKTYFAKQKELQVVQVTKSPDAVILETIIYKHRSKDIYLVAQAYDGKYIDKTVSDLIHYAAAKDPQTFVVNKAKITAGGKADLVIFIGHNYLMEWSWSKLLPTSWHLPTLSKDELAKQKSRYIAIFACQSQRYFSALLSQIGISPLILTTQNMAPEAYSIHAMIDGWSKGQSKNQIQKAVATAYSRFQKLSKPAMKMFVTEYQY